MNKTRRKILKYLAIGAIALPIAKVLGTQLFSDSPSKLSSGNSGSKGKELTLPKGEFRIVEVNNKIEFYNSEGEKILTISKDSGLEVG